MIKKYKYICISKITGITMFTFHLSTLFHNNGKGLYCCWIH